MRYLVPRFAAFSLLLAALPASYSDVSPETQEKIDTTLQKVLKPVAVATDAAIKTSQKVTDRWDARTSRMRDLFDVKLPGGIDKDRLSLDFEPKLGDFFQRRYVRFPLELRYGLTNRTELYGGLTPYTPNPFHSDPSGWGPGFFTQGARYNIMPLGRKWGFDEITFGTEARIPLGNPPVRLIDHYTHIKPYVSTARHLDSLPHTTLFWYASYDFSQKWRNEIPPGVVERDILEIGPSLLYKPDELGYFGQFAFRHITEPDRMLLGSITRGGIVWDIPEPRSAKWGLRGKWQIESAVEVETEEHQSVDVGLATRVRWKFDLK